MSTGSPYTGPQYAQGPDGRGGRSNALLIGGIAFALVFLLIVGGTVAFLVFRSSGGNGAGSGTGSTTVSDSASATTTEETASATTTPPETTPIEEERHCWSPVNERTSKNPSGRLRGGGLEITPPAIFDTRANTTYLHFTTDAQTAMAPVEGSWVSSIGVGKLEWQPGVEYPGEKAAAERLVSCLYGNASIWGDTSQRTLHDQVTEAVTIQGMPGYRSTAVLKFGKHNFTKTDSTRIDVVVLDTPEGPSVYSSEISIGVTEHEDAAAQAYESITGLTG
ncbi:hypothetical protein M4D54_11775 [Brachybacterium sp. p3-SID1565]|uniref:hypothetical protein n=1 Tax=Brachybacterium sp. p3-SID1565 TaxID=2916046 RepID=UPI0021A2C6C3|nr:hypothetical protein [Brachybacterium sp. p3-SID1565]MCT1386294.1 hypothetical protein [Brachybacterium sp. p3-SID1565]